MKQLVLTSLMCMIIMCISCQSRKTSSDEHIGQWVDSQLFGEALQAIKNNDFVFDVSSFIYNNERTTFVDATMNYIAVSAEQVKIQIMPGVTAAGTDGSSAVILDGKIISYKVDERKNGDVYFEMNIKDMGKTQYIHFLLPKGTNECVLFLSPSFDSQKLRLKGKIYPTKKSKAYKGESL